MKQWKVPMPKPAPEAGKVHFAMASKMVNGARAELHAEFSEVKARLLAWTKTLSSFGLDSIGKDIAAALEAIEELERQLAERDAESPVITWDRWSVKA